MINVIVKNATGSQVSKARLHESGLLEFECGKVSHISYELSFGKEIAKEIAAPKIEVKEVPSDIPKKTATPKKK
jgi:hypothetical protein